MGRAHTIQHHHSLPLRHWMHEHHSLVRSGFALVIAILAVAIAALSVPMVRDAIADYAAPRIERSAAIGARVLPREWQWTREPISFDHMYRDSKPYIEIDFSRNRPPAYNANSFAE